MVTLGIDNREFLCYNFLLRYTPNIQPKEGTKMEARKETRRKKILSVKFFSDEYRNLQQVARLEGLTMADFIRQAALKKRREYERAGQWA